MSNVVSILPKTYEQYLDKSQSSGLLPADDFWLKATDKKRIIATCRYVVVKQLLDYELSGRTRAMAIKKLSRLYLSNRLPVKVARALETLYPNKGFPDKSTVYRWFESYASRGLTGLLPGHKGRIRQDKGWESFALNLYTKPSKPSMNQVARELREVYGYKSATDSAVRKFINQLPRYMTHDSIGRLGASLVRKTKRDYIRRTSENLPVGCLYQGDGHTLDVYLKHPVSGHIFRPELTVWIDVKSRYIVGWWISEAESSISTIISLGHALVNHDHIPDCLYLDNGSGFKSKMMNNESYGFYARHDIDVIMALPGNPGAKGQVERFFGVMEADYCKSEFPHAFCGGDMAEEAAQAFYRKFRTKQVEAPTLAQWMDGFSAWLERYHNRPHPEFKNTTPAKLWATLEHNPLMMPASAIYRPRIERKVTRTSIRLHNREYTSDELYQFNGQQVHVEYDLHDDEQVAVLDKDTGSLLCHAHLIRKKDHLPTSRIEEYKAKRLEGQLKRKQRHIDEDIAKARGVITAEAQVEALEQLDNTLVDAIDLNALDEPQGGLLEIDILDEDC